MTALGWGFVAVGVMLIALGGSGALIRWMRRRPWADVLDMIEPKPPQVVVPLRCICTARLSFCQCAVDGKRNPRGAGRGRSAYISDTCADAHARFAERGRALLLDAIARGQGENLDGSPRRETRVRLEGRW